MPRATKSAVRPAPRATEEAPQRRYWLWVTTSEYYFEDEEGTEREALEPCQEVDAGGWWTCSQHTRAGDLILLWRTGPCYDIKYLIQAASDAYPLGDDRHAMKRGWGWGCDFQPLFKFKKPLTLDDLKAHPRLAEWGPRKAQFRLRSYTISVDDWQELNEALAAKNPEYGRFLGRAEATPLPRNVLLERDLEEAVAGDLSILRRHGHDLELHVDRKSGRTGRQFICVGAGGRIDLLCRNRKTGGFTVVELKNVRANRLTFAQATEYMGWVKKHLARGKPVNAIVVSRGRDASFQQAAEMLGDRLTWIDLKDLGFE